MRKRCVVELQLWFCRWYSKASHEICFECLQDLFRSFHAGCLSNFTKKCLDWNTNAKCSIAFQTTTETTNGVIHVVQMILQIAFYIPLNIPSTLNQKGHVLTEQHVVQNPPDITNIKKDV